MTTTPTTAATPSGTRPAIPDKPAEIALITAHALGLINSTPIIERAKDGQEVLLCGPLVSRGHSPAEQRAAAEHLMVVKLSARHLLTIAQGGTVDLGPGWTVRGGVARVRLATRVEVMVFNRRARAAMREAPYFQTDDSLPAPLDAARAAELVAPVVITPDQVRAIVNRCDPFHFG